MALSHVSYRGKSENEQLTREGKILKSKLHNFFWFDLLRVNGESQPPNAWRKGNLFAIVLSPPVQEAASHRIVIVIIVVVVVFTTAFEARASSALTRTRRRQMGLPLPPSDTKGDQPHAVKMHRQDRIVSRL